MKLEKMEYKQGSRNHNPKRVGRGFGSGIGKTCTRGTKGQNSRKSGGTRIGFEGGQNPLYRRIPKIGFNNENFANKYNVISLEKIVELNLKIVSTKVLLEKKLISDNKLPLKIIGNMDLKTPIQVEANKFSKGSIISLEKSKSKYKVL
ncbi:MAG: 50S ribosomal protein L15 [Mycoplasmoidaceae bacterium]